MALIGEGCFIAWYDMKPGHEAEHDNWHTHEHMIERVAIPGFRRGRRYRNLNGAPRVGVLYEVDTLSTLASQAYLERLNNATPWTSRTLPNFAGMNRSLCRMAATHGHGSGGYLLTIQCSPRASEADRLRDWLATTALPALSHRAGLCGGHLLIADQGVSTIGTQEKSLRGQADTVADWVVLIEAYDRPALEQALAELSGAHGLPGNGARELLVSGVFNLDFLLDEAEAKRIWQPPAPA